MATLDPDSVPGDAIERGAYVLSDPEGGEDPALILIGTGSEVGLCVSAAQTLAAEGVAVRVVSMPCMDTFAAGEQSYRDQVLPPNCEARVAVEAAARLGWDRWIGPGGAFLGMETFGESGPAEQVYEHFGITAEHVVKLGRSVLEGAGERGYPMTPHGRA
jgi:transketolase